MLSPPGAWVGVSRPATPVVGDNVTICAANLECLSCFAERESCCGEEGASQVHPVGAVTQ